MTNCPKSPAAMLLVATVCLVAGCAATPPLGRTELEPNRDAQTEADAFSQVLDDHQALPVADRNALHRRALEAAEPWRDFATEVAENTDARFRRWYYEGMPPTRQHVGFGVGNSLKALKKATELDPFFVEGWAARGRLSTEVGDQLSALRYLDHACTAAEVLAAAGRPVDDALMLDILRDRAWTLRDLARWDEGLAAVSEGLAAYPGDRDLVLIKGLLLADSGRYEDAISLAVRMEPLTYPQYDFTYRGFKDQTSAYANNWIRAMALLADGKTDLARAKLGDLSSLVYRPWIPFSWRFWRDAGLVAELAGDPQAPLYYSVGMATHPYRNFFPMSANNVTPQVLGWPDAHMPVFSAFGPAFYVGGSPFTFVGMQINLMAEGLFPEQRNQAAGRALHRLDLLEKRGIRPDICHALRGRVLYITGDYDRSRPELAEARTAFASQGQVDPITDLMLGLLDLQSESFSDAEEVLAEAVKADSTNAVAWRSLGVARVRLGRRDEAEEAMDRAVALDPGNVAGFYNRGLLRFQSGRLGPATSDLQKALALDPENREVQRLRDLIVQAATRTGADSTTVAMVARGGPLGEDANPEVMRERFQAEIDEMFTVPDSLRVDDEEAERRIEILKGRYARDRDPVTRSVLALALIDHRQLKEAQSLLAPGWGVDLSPDEEMMLLYADRELGEQERARQVVRDVIASGEDSGNPYAVYLAADIVRSFSVDPEGTDPVASNTHGFFGWFRDARSNHGYQLISGARSISGRLQSIQDFDLFRKYREDPMLEDAVWGLGRTPITGGGRSGGK